MKDKEIIESEMLTRELGFIIDEHNPVISMLALTNLITALMLSVETKNADDDAMEVFINGLRMSWEYCEELRK